MKLIACLFCLAPLGIGLSVLGFVWSEPFGGFGSPPIFFRLFASCIAGLFVLVGATGIYGILTGGGPFALSAGRALQMRDQQSRQLPQSTSTACESTTGTNYACPNCGATLGSGDDVSPHGDAKCSHCNRWFNVHQRN